MNNMVSNKIKTDKPKVYIIWFETKNKIYNKIWTTTRNIVFDSLIHKFEKMKYENIIKSRSKGKFCIPARVVNRRWKIWKIVITKNLSAQM